MPKCKCSFEYKIKPTDEWRKATVISRAGKSAGKNKFWLNVKDKEDGSLKSLNFEELSEWIPFDDEVLINTSYESEEVTRAKLDELESWKRNNVYSEVDDKGQQCISVRWVITRKMKDGNSVVKARLVARSYEEESLIWVRKDSPACCKESLRSILCIIASFKWDVKTLDIKSAFLQGNKVERDMFLKPPKEVGGNKLWRLQTTVYGLADASRIWHLTLQETLMKAGARKSKFDEAVFFWSYEGNLEGVICCHVDDIIWGGSVTFNSRIIQVIKDTFLISHDSLGSFKYVGLNITQDEDFISMHQYGYISEVKEIEIIKKRASQRNEPLTIEEARQLRRVAG